MPVHEKILHVDKEKAKYCYLTFSMRFHFSVIFFHVDICESYATLDTDERQKSGDSLLFIHICLFLEYTIRSPDFSMYFIK